MDGVKYLREIGPLPCSQSSRAGVLVVGDQRAGSSLEILTYSRESPNVPVSSMIPIAA
jgi:hypothetical protein